MDNRKFRQFYDQFCAHIKEQKWENVMETIPKITLDFCTMNTYQNHEALLLHSVSAMNYIQNTKRHVVNHVCQLYLKLLQIAADKSRIDLITESINHLEHKTQFPFGAQTKWLTSVFQCLKAAANGPKEANSIKQFVELTTTIVTFMKIENNQKFLRTKELIIWWQKYKNEEDNESMQTAYDYCFDVISATVNIFCDSVDVDEYIRKVCEQIESISQHQSMDQQMREDLCVTITQMIKHNIKHFLRANSPSGKSIENILKILINIYRNIRNANYEKRICSFCSDIKRHTTIDLCNIGYIIFEEAHLQMSTEARNDFSHIFLLELLILAKFKCNSLADYEANAMHKIRNVLLLAQSSAELAEFGIQIICKIQKEKAADKINCNIEETFLLTKLHRLYDAQSNTKGIIESGTILLAHYLTDANPNDDLIAPIFYAIHAKQQQIPANEFQTISQCLTEIGSGKYLDVFDVPTVNTATLLLWQLKNLHLYSQLSQTQKQKIIEELFNSTDNPLECLRVLYYSDVNDLEPFMSNLINIIPELPKEPTIEVFSIRGAYRTNKYLNIFTQTTTKYKEHPMNWTSIESSVFDDLNIRYENNLIGILKGTLDEYTRFLRMYSKSSNKAIYSDEVRHALLCLKTVAYHLNLREHLKETMDAYFLMYKLCNAEDNIYEQLMAVSFFAENESLFEAKNSYLDLEQVINDMDKICHKVLIEIDTLSVPKQNAIIYYLLSLVTYYMNNRQSRCAHQMLLFVKQYFERNNNGKFCSTQCKYFSVVFTKTSISNDQLPCSLMVYAEDLFKSLETLKYITADDAMILPIVLSDAVTNLFKFALARNDFFTFTEKYILMVWKMMFRIGMVAKSAKLLSFCALMDIYKEDVDQCIAKVHHLHAIFLFDSDAEKNIIPVNELNCNQNDAELLNDRSVSPVQNAAIPSTSPIKVNKPKKKIFITKYISEHSLKCTCDICSNRIYKQFVFNIALLTCGVLKLQQKFNKCQNNLNYLYKRWKKLQEQNRECIYAQQSLAADFSIFPVRILIFYAQSLLRFKANERARQILYEAYNQLCAIKHSDYALKHDIAQFISSIKYCGENMDFLTIFGWFNLHSNGIL